MNNLEKAFDCFIAATAFKAGDSVSVHWHDGKHYPATIHKTGKTTHTVEWHDGSGRNSVPANTVHLPRAFVPYRADEKHESRYGKPAQKQPNLPGLTLLHKKLGARTYYALHHNHSGQLVRTWHSAPAEINQKQMVDRLNNSGLKHIDWTTSHEQLLKNHSEEELQHAVSGVSRADRK